jgi:ribonuclease R
MEKRKFKTGMQSGSHRGFQSLAGLKRPAEKDGHTMTQRMILKALERCGGGDGVPSRALMREAGLTDKTAFYDALKALKEGGEVKIDKDHWVTLGDVKDGLPATIVSLSEKFGFARPADGGDDIFVPGSGLKGAFVGDEVIIGSYQMQEKGPSGRVAKITKRSTQSVTGTLHITPEGVMVTPDIPVRFDLKVRVQDTAGAKDRDKVLIEPKTDSRGDWRFAVVKGVFGTGDRAKICADAIIERCGIPSVFPDDVLAQAEEISKMTVTQEDIDQRLDLRDEPIFTIDSADAKDLDDAISVKKTETGYSLGVHIADVSHYIKPKTPIDLEAYRRGTSVYFADRVIPMLPEALSNGVCSLNAGTEKLTFSALMTFDQHGNMTDYSFHKTVINSKVRGVYSEVNQILAGTASKELLQKYAPVKHSLAAAKELADLLKQRAKERGEMELESDETKFVLDENGICIDIIPRTTGEAEALIEQMMVSANIAAAKASLKAEIPFLYRVHEHPQPERVASLCELLDRLTVPCGELKKGNPTAKDFAVVLQRVKGTPKESLVSQRILRTMDKAKYSHRELGHYGLALGEYSHFTSPIRRYPDTSIHRILSDLVQGEDKATLSKRYGTFAENSAADSSKNEVRAVTGERAAEDCYMAEYVRQHVGESHMGVISGATPRGIFVKLDNHAEGFVSLNDFQGAEFQYDGEVAHRDLLTGKVLMVGEPLEVIIAAADVATGRIDFVPQNPVL